MNKFCRIDSHRYVSLLTFYQNILRMIVRSIYSNDQKKKNKRQTMLEKILHRKCFSRQTTYNQANNIMYAFLISNRTNGAGAANPSAAPEFTSGFSGVCYTRSLVLYAIRPLLTNDHS